MIFYLFLLFRHLPEAFIRKRIYVSHSKWSKLHGLLAEHNNFAHEKFFFCTLLWFTLSTVIAFRLCFVLRSLCVGKYLCTFDVQHLNFPFRDQYVSSIHLAICNNRHWKEAHRKQSFLYQDFCLGRQLTGRHDELGLRVSCITNLGVPEEEEQYIIITNEMKESEWLWFSLFVYNFSISISSEYTVFPFIKQQLW